MVFGAPYERVATPAPSCDRRMLAQRTLDGSRRRSGHVSLFLAHRRAVSFNGSQLGRRIYVDPVGRIRCSCELTVP